MNPNAPTLVPRCPPYSRIQGLRFHQPFLTGTIPDVYSTFPKIKSMIFGQLMNTKQVCCPGMERVTIKQRVLFVLRNPLTGHLNILPPPSTSPRFADFFVVRHDPPKLLKAEGPAQLWCAWHGHPRTVAGIQQ